MGTHVVARFAQYAACLGDDVAFGASTRGTPSAVVRQELAARLADADTVEEAWRLGSRYLFEIKASFEQHAALYQALASQAPQALLPTWSPDSDARTNSNLASWLRYLGYSDYQALHVWSVTDPEAYWQATLDALKLTFEQSPRTLRGTPDDVEAPRWFDGARLNVARACLDGSGQPALIVGRGREQRSYTKSELRKRVQRAAAGLLRLGVNAGDAVAIAVPLGLEAVTAYLALLYVGAVVVCIAESYSEQELSVRLEITHPRWVVTAVSVRRAGKVLPLYDKFVRVQAPRAIVVLDGAEDVSLRPDDVVWESFFTHGSEPMPSVPVATPMDAMNTVLFSSGTTGAPKAIPWTPACAIKAAADAKWHLDVRSGDRLMWPTSLGWMMGAWSIFAALLNDAALVIFDDAPTLRGLGELVCAAKVTHLGVVPSLVRAWRETRTMEGLDWGSLRLFASTGECSNPTDTLYLMWLGRFRPMIEYCGGTEVAGGYITSSLLAPCVPSCFTTAALGQAFTCLDESGAEASEGEAFLTVPSVGLSTSLLNRDHHAEYYAGTPRPGLRRHGDLVSVVAPGYYRVLGRADDTMNLGGVKVSSAEIERACADLPAVRELAAIAVAPPDGGPSVLVLCVATSDEAPNLEKLLIQAQQRVRERVNPLFKVTNVVLVDALPRTASNKVMRRVLRSRYERKGS